MSPVRQHWQRKALRYVPPRADLRGRNAAVTAMYAKLYMERPDVFKTYGASAFSSHRVGLVLTLYEFLGRHGLTTQALGLAGRFSERARRRSERRAQGLRANLDLLRKANNDIYDEIAWAHLAYVGKRRGGIEAVEAGALGNDGQSVVLEAFRRIDEGARLRREALAGGDASQLATADGLIWDGNLLLLRYEQEVILQPCLERLSLGMNVFLSALTWIDFDLETFLPLPHDWWLHPWRFLRDVRRRADFRIDMSWFFGAMLLRNPRLLMSTRSLPSFARLDHRWAWIEQRVMKLWRKVEARDPTVPAKVKQVRQGALVCWSRPPPLAGEVR